MLASTQIVIDNFERELAGPFGIDHAFSEQNMVYHDIQLLRKMEEMYYWQ